MGEILEEDEVFMFLEEELMFVFTREVEAVGEVLSPRGVEVVVGGLRVLALEDGVGEFGVVWILFIPSFGSLLYVGDELV